MEELRWLDYQWRLSDRKRTPLSGKEARESGDILFEKTFLSGCLAIGENRKSYFETGKPFNAVAFKKDHPLIATRPENSRISSAIFNSDSSAIDTVITGGNLVVKSGKHVNQNEFLGKFRAEMENILSF